VRTDNNDLAKQVAHLLRRRPGWKVQAMSTPGAPLIWSFGSGRGRDVSVKADKASIGVSVEGTDREVVLRSTSELVAWLQSHRPGSLGDPRGGIIDTLRSGKLFKWG
jgi:hypothetical protein